MTCNIVWCVTWHFSGQYDLSCHLKCFITQPPDNISRAEREARCLGCPGSPYTLPRPVLQRGYFGAAEKQQNQHGRQQLQMIHPTWLPNITDTMGCLCWWQRSSHFTCQLPATSSQTVRCWPTTVCLLQWLLGAQRNTWKVNSILHQANHKKEITNYQACNLQAGMWGPCVTVCLMTYDILMTPGK